MSQSWSSDNARSETERLLAKYQRIQEEGRVAHYKEEEAKKDLILPLFGALGWDINNDRAYEVSAEETISRGRVDYGFKINDVTKFYVEAKALNENLDDPALLKQAIGYGYAKGVTWAVLTNFSRTRILNAEVKEANPARSVFIDLSAPEYLSRFDQLSLLSRPAFQEGLLDREAEKWGKRTRKQPIDKQLLMDLSGFRLALSKDILRLNPGKFQGTEEALDETVQRLLDRLIFIRVTEDRGMEQPTLRPLERDTRTTSLLKGLRQTFTEFDKNYDSRLFTPHLVDEMRVDDDVLREVIRGLYETADQTVAYDFAAIDADVLGVMYEQYLGLLLRKTPKRAALQDGTAHRKEQGIYYTPTWVVDYIVRFTIDSALQRKGTSPEKLRIMDPACGSGSFLLRAYDRMRELRVKAGAGQAQARFDMDTEGIYATRVAILKDNLYGVDLDPKAVEIAQLNLMIRAAESRHRLPTLERNIKVGNSIIQDPAFDPIAISWEERFPEVVQGGGFDVIVGNPPYNAELTVAEKSHLREKYPDLRSGDTAEYFLRQSAQLLSPGGCMGFIVPKSIAYYDGWSGIRKFLLSNFEIVNIADVGIVFPDANLEELIVIARRARPIKGSGILVTRFSDLKRPQPVKHKEAERGVSYGIMRNRDILVFSPLTPQEQGIIEKVDSKSSPFEKLIADSFRGVYITDADKQRLKEGGTEFILKEPWVQRYGVERTIKISPTSAFFDKKKLARTLRKKLILKVLRGRRLSCHLDLKGSLLTPTNVNNIVLREDSLLTYELILGLLNSSLYSFYIQKALYSDTTESARHLDTPYVEHLPMPDPTISSAETVKTIEELVRKQLLLESQIASFGDAATDERHRLIDAFDSNDKKIDEAVFSLFGLTPEEKDCVTKYFG